MTPGINKMATWEYMKMLIWGEAPVLRECTSGVVGGLSVGALPTIQDCRKHDKTQNSGSKNQSIPDTRHKLKAHRKQETGSSDPSQPGGPLKGAGGYIYRERERDRYRYMDTDIHIRRPPLGGHQAAEDHLIPVSCFLCAFSLCLVSGML